MLLEVPGGWVACLAWEAAAAPAAAAARWGGSARRAGKAAAATAAWQAPERLVAAECSPRPAVPIPGLVPNPGLVLPVAAPTMAAPEQEGEDGVLSSRLPCPFWGRWWVLLTRRPSQKGTLITYTL